MDSAGQGGGAEIRSFFWPRRGLRSGRWVWRNTGQLAGVLAIRLNLFIAVSTPSSIRLTMASAAR